MMTDQEIITAMVRYRHCKIGRVIWKPQKLYIHDFTKVGGKRFYSYNYAGSKKWNDEYTATMELVRARREMEAMHA